MVLTTKAEQQREREREKKTRLLRKKHKNTEKGIKNVGMFCNVSAVVVFKFDDDGKFRLVSSIPKIRISW